VVGTFQALSASVIYGPNAAGKTSIANAMSCFRQIVLKETIEDSEDDHEELFHFQLKIG
jgi:AAA15 family ATPase/GTPase